MTDYCRKAPIQQKIVQGTGIVLDTGGRRSTIGLDGTAILVAHE
jgi:hypothetical protein